MVCWFYYLFYILCIKIYVPTGTFFYFFQKSLVPTSLSPLLIRDYNDRQTPVDIGVCTFLCSVVRTSLNLTIEKRWGILLY